MFFVHHNLDSEQYHELKLALHDLSSDYIGNTQSPMGADGVCIILNFFRPVLEKELKDSITQ